MKCRRLCGVLLLALLIAACGSPTASVPTNAAPGSPGPTGVSTPPVDSPQTTTTVTTPTTTRAPKPPAKRPPQPTAKGQPLDIFLPFRTGIPYTDKEREVLEGIKKGCGGTLCVKVALIVSVTRDPSIDFDCLVSSVDQPKPIFAGDTIKIYIEDPCDGRPPGKTSGAQTTTTTT